MGPLGPGAVCMSVAVKNYIVYIMPTMIGCMSVGVYIGIAYILPIIGGYV